LGQQLGSRIVCVLCNVAVSWGYYAANTSPANVAAGIAAVLEWQ
jgi:hypothetical protein